jgi:hypothetical protein
MTALEQGIQTNHATRMILKTICKQQTKIIHRNCGFGFCPKIYKYLANPMLLEEIFSNPNSQIAETTTSTKNKGYMKSTACKGCKKKYLLRVVNPICLSCRRIY